MATRSPTIGSCVHFRLVSGYTHLYRISNGVKWLDDVQEFYREKSTIEKEYGNKLQALAKKFQERRTKKTASLSVGDNPTMTPGSLENASVTTWARILDNTKLLGDEKVAHSDELKMQVAEQLKALSFRWEDYRKRCDIFNAKLVEERDQTYTDLKHVQKKYFDQCGSVEKERMKASNDGRSSKHNKMLQGNMTDMNNLKNSYLISINASNAHKAKYYHEDVPYLLDIFQDMNEIRVQKLNIIWQKATQLERSCLIRQGGHLGASIEAIGRNEPTLDTGMFLQHNSSGFNEPPPFVFEPCPIWHDTAEIVVDESSRVYLQNALAKSRKELQALSTSVTNKKREIDGLSKLKVACAADPTRGNVEDVLMNLLNSSIGVSTEDVRRNKLSAEVDTITKVAGDIDRGMTEHVFKSASFAIPTTCDFCGSTIWGMSRKGYHCKACSYNCHKNCQMKVPANCTQEKGNKKTAEQGTGGPAITRTSTMSSTAESVYGVSGRPAQIDDSDSDSDDAPSTASGPSIAPARNSAVPGRRTLAPPPSAGFANGGASASLGTEVLYAYDAASPGELSISEGETVSVLEGDDGSGWIKVKGPRGQGLVPAAYVRDATPKSPGVVASSRPLPARTASAASNASSMRPTGRQGPAVAPKRSTQKKGRQVRAIYDYEATGPGELSIVEGDLLEVTVEDQGDGWSTGEMNGRSGIFPTAYVQ